MNKVASSMCLRTVVAAAALAALTGITRCNQTCIEYDDDGNYTKFACTLCSDYSGNPCVGRHWNLPGGSECLFENQPKMPDGIDCDVDEGSGVCMSGVCVVDAACGDGVVTGTEACDDGANNGAGDGFCLADCSATQVCGDGTTNGTEFCEATDTVDCTTLGFIGGTAACNATCDAWNEGSCTMLDDCGNGVTDPGELCDDGVNMGGEGNCLACNAIQTCGDGAAEGTESCDDGANNGTGDGFCLSDCSTTQTCGDGTTNGTEACDDGVSNGTGNGFCLSDCSATQTCGDGVQNGTETCESGDSVECTSLSGGFIGGDALCSATCQAWDASTCTTVEDCGNGFLDPGESCDDGDNDGGEGECLACMGLQSCGDGTSEGTEACDEGVANGSGPGVCVQDCSGIQVCGDGIPNGTEVCDDGVNDGGPNGCLPGCQEIQTCGDGVPQGTEACDDGPDNGTGEGFCLSDCSALQACGDGTQNGTEFCEVGDTEVCMTIDAGFIGGTALCNGACTAWDLATCTTPEDCGNGVVDDGEVCDDGENVGGEGLCIACQAVQTCGDGIVNGTEQCDDENQTDDDGCNSCQNGLIACDITAATCPTGWACYPTGTANPNTGNSDWCLPPGSLPEGSACSAVNDCQAGNGCVPAPGSPSSLQCSALCDSILLCADGDPCVGLNPPSQLSACRLETCDLFNPSCGPGAACYPAEVTFVGTGQTFDGIFCLPVGATPVGDACTGTAPTPECVPGATCVDSVCREYCDVANPACPVGTTCQATGDPAYGACIEDSP